jgi:serine/threonine protein phosphatase PrpC
MAVEVAAGVTLDEMEHKGNQRSSGMESIPGVRRQLVHAIEASDTAIRQALEAGPPASGPVGSSLTLAYLVWPLLYTAHVGDTGAFVVRGDKLIPLTTEHCVPPEERDADSSHWHRAVWNLLGDSESVPAPELSKFRLDQYDRLLICSHGIHGTLTEAEIVKVLSGPLSSRATAQELVRAAARKNDEVPAVAIVGSMPATPSLPLGA